MHRKIQSRARLKKICEELRAEGKTIVFTNGCFDILHKGHVRYLEQARKLGDVLIIGLNADNSVSALKPGRPVNPEADRAEVLAALAAVDFISIFREETPYALIRALRPDVLVKGGDWKEKDIVGSDLVRETHSLPFVKGVSTTGIIARIRRISK